MTILSRTGLRAAFIAFGRDILASLVLVFGLMFIPVKALANCEDDLGSMSLPLLAQTKYVDIEKLASLSRSQLKAQSESMAVLRRLITERRQELSTKREGLLAGIAQESITLKLEQELGIHKINERLNVLEEDLRGIDRYISLLQRMSSANFNIPSTKIMRSSVDVTGRSPTEVMKMISKCLKSLRKSKEELVLRFIPIARQDILLEYGIDNYGREHGSGDSWDMFGLEGILQKRGLKAYDGFYALSQEETETMGAIVDGIQQPFAMVEDFTRGDRALAVYDASQLELGDGDFYFFNNPDQRKKALIAFILPARQR